MFKNFQKRNTRQDILNDTLPTGVMHGQDQGKSNTQNHQHHTSHKGTSSHALTLKPKDENMTTSIYNMERRLNELQSKVTTLATQKSSVSAQETNADEEVLLFELQQKVHLIEVQLSQINNRIEEVNTSISELKTTFHERPLSHDVNTKHMDMDVDVDVDMDMDTEASSNNDKQSQIKHIHTQKPLIESDDLKNMVNALLNELE